MVKSTTGHSSFLFSYQIKIIKEETLLNQLGYYRKIVLNAREDLNLKHIVFVFPFTLGEKDITALIKKLNPNEADGISV